MGIKVCHISTVHKKNDIRIFHKECKALAAAGYDVVYISPGKHLESEGGVILRGSGMPAGWHKARRLTAGCRITIKAALAEDADIYHIHDGELSRFIKRLKKAGSNVVYDSHEHLPMQIFEKEWIPPLLRKPVSRIADIVEMRSVRNADLIIAVADKTVERFQNLGIKIIKLENLPILGEFEGIRIDPAVRAAGRKVCYSGTIWIERGLDTMCAAVREMGNRCFLEIAGRIDHGNPAKFTGGSDSNIRYSGYLSRDELFRVYEESAAGLCLFKPFPNNMIDPPTK
ncbi:MAG: glycosyltransferase, partial [Clostridia bacterium]